MMKSLLGMRRTERWSTIKLNLRFPRDTDQCQTTYHFVNVIFLDIFVFEAYFKVFRYFYVIFISFKI